MSSNLKRRGQTWSVRVGVNPKYHKLIGKTETVLSLKTRDKAEAIRRSYSAIADIRDHHDRLIREAESGVSGLTASAVSLRLQIEDGSLDTDTAKEALHTELEDKLRDFGLSEKQINELTASDIRPALKAPFRMLSDTDYLPLKAAIKQYLDLVENDVTPRTWQQKEKQLNDLRRVAQIFVLRLLKLLQPGLMFSDPVEALLARLPDVAEDEQ